MHEVIAFVFLGWGHTHIYKHTLFPWCCFAFRRNNCVLTGLKSRSSVKGLSEMGMQSKEQGKANLPRVLGGRGDGLLMWHLALGWLQHLSLSVLIHPTSPPSPGEVILRAGEKQPCPWNTVFFPGSLLETDTILHSAGPHGAPLGRQLPASCWWSNFWVSGCISA